MYSRKCKSTGLEVGDKSNVRGLMQNWNFHENINLSLNMISFNTIFKNRFMNVKFKIKRVQDPLDFASKILLWNNNST